MTTGSQEFDEFRGMVLRHDAELSKLTGLPEMTRNLWHELQRLRPQLDELLAWKDDSKVQHIHDLQGKVKLLEQEKTDTRKEVERDRLDLKRSVRAAIVSAIISALVGWGFAKLTQPQPAQIVAPAK